MENIPFGSSSDEEEKPSSIFEISKDDDDDSEESKRKKSKKASSTKRSILFGAEKPAEESPSAEESPKSIFSNKGEGLFSSLLDKETDNSDKATEDTAEQESPQLAEEFQEVVEDRISDVEGEISSSPVEGNEEAVADASFLSSVGERMAGGTPPEEAINEAMVEVTEELENPPLEVDPHMPEIIEPDNFEADEDDEPESTTTKQPITPIPAAPAQPTNNPNTQPITPINPFTGGPAGSAPAGGGPPYNSPNSPNFNAAPATPNLSPDSPDISKMNSLYYRDKRRGGLLVGGAIGYLFGRRRGRIKTEERLEPEIDKRNTEISKLEGDLERSEDTVRAAAAENSKQSFSPVNEQVSTQLESINVNELDKNQTLEKSVADKDKEHAVEEAETQFTNEPEKLGNIETAAVAMAKSIEKVTADRPKSPAENARDVKTMSVSELLEIAENISLESQSLKELYELRKIDAVNLRRVIIEYLTGNNYDRLLRKSLEAVDLEQKKSIESKQSSVDDGVANQRQSQDSPNVAAPSSLDVPLRQDQLQGDNAQDSARSFDDSARNSESNMTVSNNTAIMLGIVTGLIIMAVIAFYSGSF